MLPPRYVVSLMVISLMVLGAGVTCGQNTSTGSGQAYPNKPIRIVAAAPGGGSDFNARLIAQGLNSALGQSVIVENRRGTIFSVETVMKATPDGYTLLAIGSTFWLAPFLQDNARYDPVRDFVPVSLVNRAPNVLVVHPSLPVKSVPELIALAKAKPGALNYAAAVTGSPAHLAGVLFKAMTGVNIVGVPYKGAGAAAIAVLAGEVQLIFASATTVAPHIKSGRLNALAVTSAQPSALFPGLPTVAAAGVPGYEAGSMQGIFGPAKLPARILERLNQEIARFLRTAEAKEKSFNSGVEAVGSSAEEFAITIRSDMARMGKVIKDAGIRAD